MYYQQAMEAQARQQVEQQAQFMIQKLQQLLYKDEKYMIEMLLASRNRGKMLNGFAVEQRAEGLGIVLINEE